MESTTEFFDSPRSTTAALLLDASARALLEEFRQMKMESERRLITAIKGRFASWECSGASSPAMFHSTFDSYASVAAAGTAATSGFAGGSGSTPTTPIAAAATDFFHLDGAIVHGESEENIAEATVAVGARGDLGSSMPAYDSEPIYDDDDVSHLDNEPIFYDDAGCDEDPSLETVAVSTFFSKQDVKASAPTRCSTECLTRAVGTMVPAAAGFTIAKDDVSGDKWGARYEVALSVAHAMTYLHLDYRAAMRLLLSPACEPYIVDFDLAHILSVARGCTLKLPAAATVKLPSTCSNFCIDVSQLSSTEYGIPFNCSMKYFSLAISITAIGWAFMATEGFSFDPGITMDGCGSSLDPWPPPFPLEIWHGYTRIRPLPWPSFCARAATSSPCPIVQQQQSEFHYINFNATADIHIIMIHFSEFLVSVSTFPTSHTILNSFGSEVFLHFLAATLLGNICARTTQAGGVISECSGTVTLASWYEGAIESLRFVSKLDQMAALASMFLSTNMSVVRLLSTNDSQLDILFAMGTNITGQCLNNCMLQQFWPHTISAGSKKNEQVLLDSACVGVILQLLQWPYFYPDHVAMQSKFIPLISQPIYWPFLNMDSAQCWTMELQCRWKVPWYYVHLKNISEILSANLSEPTDHQLFLALSSETVAEQSAQDICIFLWIDSGGLSLNTFISDCLLLVLTGVSPLSTPVQVMVANGQVITQKWISIPYKGVLVVLYGESSSSPCFDLVQLMEMDADSTPTSQETYSQDIRDILGQLSDSSSCQLVWINEVVQAYVQDSVAVVLLTKMLVVPDSILIWLGSNGDIQQNVMRLSGLSQPLRVPSHAWTTVSLDFIGGLPTSGASNCIRVLVDKLSQYGHFLQLHLPFTAAKIAMSPSSFNYSPFEVLYGHKPLEDCAMVFHMFHLTKSAGYNGVLIPSLPSQVRVPWSSMDPLLATWEYGEALLARFPYAPAWGHAGSQPEGNVKAGVATTGSSRPKGCMMDRNGPSKWAEWFYWC